MDITDTTDREERQEADIREVLDEEHQPERNPPSLHTRRVTAVGFALAAFASVIILLVAGYFFDGWEGVVLFAAVGGLYLGFMGFFIWLMARGYIRARQHAAEVAKERHPEDFDGAASAHM